MISKTSPGSLLSGRVRSLKERTLSRQPRLSCERLRCLAESYRETEGQPAVLRRAKVFERLLREMTIFIDDNVIVGTMTQYPGGIQPYPEYSCEWMASEAQFHASLGTIQIDEGDRALLRETVDYWRDKCIALKARQYVAERHEGETSYDDLLAAGICSASFVLPSGRICVDYEKVLTRGLDGVVKEAEREAERLPRGSLESLRRRDFLAAVAISCRAVASFASRYAALAHYMAQHEENPERSRELEEIARVCEQVPARPARTFREALQSFWFTHLAIEIERCTSGISPGRFALYMYPFYARDKAAGMINSEEAIELLQLLFLKFSEVGRYQRGESFRQNMGSMFQNLSLGGLTTDGRDATSELDYLLLEAQQRVQLIQPTLSVMFHEKLPHDFLVKAAELVRTGIGMPAFFNNDVTVQRLLSHGASLEDARNHTIIGCVESGFSHTCNSMRGGGFSAPKMLELALNDGRDMVTGKQLGPRTGVAEEFSTYDELVQAVTTHLRHFLPWNREAERVGVALNAELLPLPFTSALVDDCIKKGQDMLAGGSRYSMDGATAVGVVDLADSLAAIKRCVFEEKSVTMGQLLEALRGDFVGKEELLHRLLEAPKYGNDDDYVDSIARQMYDAFWDAHRDLKDHLGRDMRAHGLSITYHFILGAKTGALPSGRKARAPFADGSVSASPGSDRQGPTALISSAAKAMDTSKFGATLLNMKFHPSALRDGAGLEKLIALVRTYMQLGGHHVQFNVVGAETLRDAQASPDNHRDLIVRVAGFSAFFVQLDPSVQNEVIRRTELSFDEGQEVRGRR